MTNIVKHIVSPPNWNQKSVSTTSQEVADTLFYFQRTMSVSRSKTAYSSTAAQPECILEVIFGQLSVWPQEEHSC